MYACGCPTLLLTSESIAKCTTAGFCIANRDSGTQSLLLIEHSRFQHRARAAFSKRVLLVFHDVPEPKRVVIDCAFRRLVHTEKSRTCFAQETKSCRLRLAKTTAELECTSEKFSEERRARLQRVVDLNHNAKIDSLFRTKSEWREVRRKF